MCCLGKARATQGHSQAHSRWARSRRMKRGQSASGGERKGRHRATLAPGGARKRGRRGHSALGGAKERNVCQRTSGTGTLRTFRPWRRRRPGRVRPSLGGLVVRRHNARLVVGRQGGHVWVRAHTGTAAPESLVLLRLGGDVAGRHAGGGQRRPARVGVGRVGKPLVSQPAPALCCAPGLHS